MTNRAEQRHGRYTGGAQLRLVRPQHRDDVLTIRIRSDLILRFQAHLGQPVAQGIAGQSQQPRGLALVAVGAAQGFADDVLLVWSRLMPSGRK